MFEYKTQTSAWRRNQHRARRECYKSDAATIYVVSTSTLLAQALIRKYGLRAKM